MIDAIVDNTVVEEPVVEAEPTVEPVVEEPAIEPETPVEPSSAASEEPVVEGNDPIAEPEAEVEHTVVEPEVEPVEPTIEEQFTALQATLEAERAEYSELSARYAELQSEFNTLQAAHAELVEFKRQSDDAKKDEMIEKFYMLDEDDKKDVISNKANYTVEEIEEKLSVICFRKKVNFDLEDNSKNNNKIEQPAVTFNVSNIGASKPDWLIAVDNSKAKNI